ncbi:unnamed protein product [Durusdinium trenchii]|uniref:Uncharacterized protein n=2 Tax=Durusdinium trenchii TaxID=1381693 RepID=A0ABP0RMZ0_9DINO
MASWNGRYKVKRRRAIHSGQAHRCFKWIEAAQAAGSSVSPLGRVAQSSELSIPLLAVSSVREYKQDALGMIFFVRYKASGGARVQVLFRAANSESRTAWVSDICEAIRQARSEASGR